MLPVNPHVLTIAGWVLLIGGLVLFLIAVLAALLRVRGQYSRAMQGTRGLYLGASIAAIARFWPALIPVIVGAAILLLNR